MNSNWKITKIQLALYKEIRNLEIGGITHTIEQWHLKNDGRLKRLKQKCYRFDMTYVAPLPNPIIKVVPNKYKNHPEYWQLADRPDAPPKEKIMAHIKNQYEIVKLTKQINKLEGAYLKAKLRLKMMDKINGSLKEQGIH